MLYGFDLDGTLALTKPAVEQSYIRAGVMPPPGYWGKPWREWLDDELAHARKNAIYEEIANELILPLPFAKKCRDNQRNSIILT